MVAAGRVLLGVGAVLGLTLVTLSAPADGPRPGFAAFVDDYYAALFAHDPNQASYAGVHDYDDRLADYSEAALTKRVAALKEFRARLGRLGPDQLTADDRLDAEILAHAIDAELLELTEVRDWARNPVVYLSKPAEGIDLLMKRTFAPAPERLRLVIGRLRATPALLEAMRAQVKNPPREFADLALIVSEGSAEFFRTTLPAWAKESCPGDAKLLAEFTEANRAVVAAFDQSTAWVKSELLPTANGLYAIGAEAFLKKLKSEEMLEIDLARLLKIGEENLARDQAEFRATAKLIDPTRSPEEVLARLTDDHPKPGDLVAFARGTIENTRKFLIDKDLVTIPSEVRPTVDETPAFMRTGGFASMDTPGAFELRATEAFYYVTPPEADWDRTRQTEHMRQFHQSGMEVITIHEAYPGHYLQFLNAKQYPTKVRKLYTCGTNVEGWAHYAEQMCVEEGYGNRDPRVKLAQLSEALLRDCRYIVGIKLHTENWTVKQGQEFFVREGLIEPETAFQEARRGTYNPTYLYYTLGKLQIYKLRADVAKAEGARFSLKRFHDRFVAAGGVPLKVMRQLFLPGDTSPTL